MSIVQSKTRRKVIYFVGWISLLLCFYFIISLWFSLSNPVQQSISSTVPFQFSSQSSLYSFSSSPFSTFSNNTTNPIIVKDDDDGDDDDDSSRFCNKITKYKDDQCDFANRFCPEPQAGGYINYIQSLYCTFSDIQWLYFILLFIWLVVLFYLLSDTAENYFCPSLTEISQLLHLSPDVAGVTLLALGNGLFFNFFSLEFLLQNYVLGAPDVSSILVSVLQSNPDFGVGEPITAGLLVTTFVMALVILFGKTKEQKEAEDASNQKLPFKTKLLNFLLEPIPMTLPFIRDASIYLISVIFIFTVVLITGQIAIWQAIVCLLFYAFYVSTVVLNKYGFLLFKWIQKKRKAKATLQKKKTKKNLSITKQQNYGSTADSVNVPNAQRASVAQQLEAMQQEPFGSDYYDTEKESSTDEEQEISVVLHSPSKWNISSTNNSFFNASGSSNKNSIYYSNTVGHLPPNRSHTMEQQSMDEEIEEKQNLLHQQHKEEEEEEAFVKETPIFYPKIGLVTQNKATDSFIIDNHFQLHKHHYHHHNIQEEVVLKEEESQEEMEKKKPLQFVWNFLQWIGFLERNWFERMLFIFEAPLILLRNLTIPKADKDDWSKFFAVLNPIFMPMFIVFAIQYHTLMIFNGKFPLIVFVGLLGIVPSIILLIILKSKKPPKYHFIFVILSFVMSIFWIYAVANELVNLLESIGILLRISNIILAATVLALGNSLGDIASNLAVARQGYPDMAVAAIYSSPVLNLLIGLGIGSIGYSVTHGGAAFPVQLNPTVVMGFVFLLMSLAAALIVIVFNRLKAPKIFALFLLLIYLLFMILSILTEFDVIFSDF